MLGGIGITGSADDTVYVPTLNLDTALSNDDALTELLVRASDGTVKYRTASSIGGGGEFLPLSGGTVTGETIFTSGVTFTSGLTTNTISATSITADYFYGDGSNLGGVVGLTYSDLGFTITSPTPTTIGQDVVLPYNSTVTYPTPLIIDPGYSVTVPVGTTLTII